MFKKKILFITGEFLPYTRSVGGIIRALSFINDIKKLHDVKILSAKKNFYGYFGFKSHLSGIKKKYIYVEKKIQKNKILLFLKYIFPRIVYTFAFDYNFFYLKNYKKALNREIVFFKPDYILISAPPFSLFKLVNEIKKKNENIKIILDYRDGWTFRVNTIFFYILKRIMNYYERKIVLMVDYCLCATKKIYDDISSIKKKNVILLTNGYLKLNNKIKKLNNKNNNKILIGYFGLISDSPKSYRDVNIIFNSIKNIENFKFDFFGNSKINDQVIKNYKFFSFKKNLDYSNAIKMMNKYDYLLILHTEKSTSAEVVTGKFYEYLSVGKPIIVISNGQTEVGKIVKKLNLGYDIDYSKTSLNNFFMTLQKEFELNFNININNLKYYSRFYQNKKLIKILR